VPHRRGCLRRLGGCLSGLVLLLVAAGVLFWLLTATLNPWALHVGGRSTPLFYWHGFGNLVSKDGRSYPLYVTFWPGRPLRHSGGRREGKGWSADLDGTGWLCLAPGQAERMDLSGTMYGGYLSAADSLFDFRLLERRKAFALDAQHRGFFDVAGQFHGPDLVMDRAGEQGIRLNTGPFIDHARVTLRWADKSAFDSACR
jgi:hypothetical protein